MVETKTPSVTTEAIGEAIRQTRDDMNMSRSLLSVRTRNLIHRNSIMRIEQGKGSSVATLMLVAEGMRVPLSAIILRAEEIQAQHLVRSENSRLQ